MTRHIIIAVVVALLLAMFLLAIIGRDQYIWTHSDTEKNDQSARDPYWYHVLVAIDCFANALLGGYIGETISCRCGRWALSVKGHGTVWHWIARFMVRWLGVIQPDHGQRAIAGAFGRAMQLCRVCHESLNIIEASRQ